MKKETFIRLIDAYLQGSATSEERRIVETYYQKLEQKGKTLLRAKDEQALKQAILSNIIAGVEAADQAKTSAKINSSTTIESSIASSTTIKSSTTIESVRESKTLTLKLWKLSAAVAAAAAAITLGVWLYYSSTTSRHAEFISASRLANDIAPGKNTATLTLDNGKTILLSDSKTGVVIGKDKFVYNDGSEIPDQVRDDAGARHDKAEMFIVSTPRGGQYQVVLPDGTKVWLNAESKMSFPSQFIGRERKVLLTSGEAYFEVTRNKSMPFIVESEGANSRPGQRLTVLGTHFNINNYADEGSTRTTLLEGSVKINEATILKPGQQSVLTNNSIEVKQIDPADILDWKNEEFVFNEQTITDIMRKVSRWYDVGIVFTQNIDTEQTFSGKVSRNKRISEVLKIMQSTGQVNFRIEGRTVYVIK